jgi:hypothetical protein
LLQQCRGVTTAEEWKQMASDARGRHEIKKAGRPADSAPRPCTGRRRDDGLGPGPRGPTTARATPCTRATPQSESVAFCARGSPKTSWDLQKEASLAGCARRAPGLLLGVTIAPPTTWRPWWDHRNSACVLSGTRFAPSDC